MTALDVANYAAKAIESLESAESEYLSSRFNTRVNRCYDACFQAAIAALIAEGIRPPPHTSQWGHEFVQAQFVGRLINRRKLYPSALRSTLARNYELRQIADYAPESPTETQANRALYRTREFVRDLRIEEIL